MRRFLSVLPFAFALAVLATPASAQGFQQPSGFTVENPVLRRVWALGMDSSQTHTLAQVLLDSLGPRLTASPSIEAAQDWLVQTYQAWGIPARKERYGTWRGWRRGTTHIDLVAPRVRSLEGMMLAWSPGTPRGRTVRAAVVTLSDVADSAAFAAWLPQAKGKFVLVSFPQPTCRPDTSWERWGMPATVDSMKARRTAAQQAWTQRVGRTGYPGAALHRRLDAALVAGVITSGWSQGWGVNKIFGTTAEHVPVVDVACEDYGLLFRLAQQNQGPVVELAASSEARGEVPVFNVVAEIRGSERPNEYVMLSAHFDSWDGGSGATDNGTGTITMLEAMRILKLAYPTPRRTILVGHWSGEEQGLNGSSAFVQDHPQIADSLQALFNQDNGTWRIEYIRMMGLTRAGEFFGRWLAKLPREIESLIDLDIPGEPERGGSDHMSFLCEGAPAFRLQSHYPDYRQYTWHTNRDTYDKVSWDDVRNNATLTAMLVYLASEDPERMPRVRRDVFAPQPNGQPGAWPACRQPQRSTPKP